MKATTEQKEAIATIQKLIVDYSLMISISSRQNKRLPSTFSGSKKLENVSEDTNVVEVMLGPKVADRLPTDPRECTVLTSIPY